MSDTLWPKTTIIILNWNGWRDTVECLKSLEKLDYPNFEVAVVDNGSTDESAARIEEFVKPLKDKFPAYPAESAGSVGRHVLSYKLQENLGFAGGNNYALRRLGVIASDQPNRRGAKQSRNNTGDEIASSPLDKLGASRNDNNYILLLNNDTIVDPSFLGELVKVAEADDSIGIAGPMIYFFDKPDYINSAGSRVNWLMNKGTYIGYNEKDAGQFGEKPYEVDYISGTCLLIKREVIEKIGLMPEDYFLYYEDTDWNFQAKKAGYKSVLVPTAKIWHKESASAKKIGMTYIYYHVRNGLLFNYRCAPLYKRIAVQLYNLWVLAKQIIKLFIPPKRGWAKATINGMRDYYRGNFGRKE